MHRYEPAQSFGVINSAASNLVYFHTSNKPGSGSGSGSDGRRRSFLATSGVRQVLIWNVHTGDLEFSLGVNDPQDSNPNITSLAVDPSSIYVRLAILGWIVANNPNRVVSRSLLAPSQEVFICGWWGRERAMRG